MTAGLADSEQASAPRHRPTGRAGSSISAHNSGQNLLTRGLRALLAHTVIFHWNRFGLPATTPGILARAATAIYLPDSSEIGDGHPLSGHPDRQT